MRRPCGSGGLGGTEGAAGRGRAIPPPRKPRTGAVDPFGQLTPRELEVLRLIARGLTNQEIARELVISHHTVKNHVSSIYRKVGSDDRTRVALMAIRAGVASLD